VKRGGGERGRKGRGKRESGNPWGGGGPEEAITFPPLGPKACVRGSPRREGKSNGRGKAQVLEEESTRGGIGRGGKRGGGVRVIE